MRTGIIRIGYKKIFHNINRGFKVSSIENACHTCKLLVVGGGSGGCTMAAKLAKKIGARSIIVLEPSDDHYYQPLFTLVGAGVKKVADCHRSEKTLLPPCIKWVKASAEKVEPEKCTVTTSEGDTINYEYLILAAGLTMHYEKIPGLKESLDDPQSRVSTIYSPQYCEKVFSDLQCFSGGHAIFTYPDTAIKCPGAPQKIAYLTDAYLNKKKIRSKAKISYNSNLPVIFGVPKYANALCKVAARKQIEVNLKTLLKEIRPDTKEAVFLSLDQKCEFAVQYDLLHVTPPQRTPQFLRENKELTDAAGFLNVNKYTLQHVKYHNIFGLGDCTSTPNSKTAAAIAKQSFVLQDNLLAVMKKNEPSLKYDGYGACPLLTEFGKCILAEFLYDGVVHETMPFDQAQESALAYYMKKDLFPFLYWNFMLKGNYNGPEFVRRIINPFGNQRRDVATAD